ncbi:MAG: N-6 DNA methylase [candidate division WOR-3 bacterium]|nr:N-6 DNA methylase [candidate division WOR-3 bacterium]
MQTVNTLYKSNQANKHLSREEKILGQFFTPPEVAEFIVSFASNYALTKKSACDPACGDGVFLSSLLNHGFKPMGVDIDENIINSLPENIKKYTRIGNGLSLSKEAKFDLVVGNPPFSSKYGRVKGDILKNFDLGRQSSSQAIEILFLEKFMKLCKKDGVIGIILPQGIFSDIRLSYVRKYIRKYLSIIAIISLPRNIFRSRGTKTSSKTCILVGKKDTKASKGKIMFASVNSTDELSKKNIRRKILVIPNEFLYPEFYLERNQMLDGLPKLKEFKVEIIQGSTRYGNERRFSSKGIPFISAKTVTSIGIDFSRDEKYIESDGIMDRKRAHVDIGDVVFIRVGVGCIGRAAVVTKESEKGIADDWIYIIRIKDVRLSPFYLAFWIQTSIIQREIRRLARGVGTTTIPIGLLKELPIQIPNSSILKKCEEKYQKIILERENKHYEKAQQIKDEICKGLESSLLKMVEIKK